MKTCEFKTRTQEDLNTEYKLQGVKFNDTEDFWDEINKCYPESEDCMIRNNMILDGERDAFEKQTEDLVCHIFFCHGFFVDRFARKALGKDHTNEDGYCLYCAISAIKFEQEDGKKKETVLLNASDDHVKTKGAPFMF